MRAENLRRAPDSQQRIVDVTGDPEFSSGEPGRDCGEVDGSDPLKFSATDSRGDPVSPGVEKFRPERLKHTGAPVDGGAAADTENNFTDRQFQQSKEQFSGSESGGALWIEFVGFQAFQSAGLGHFEDAE